VVPLLSHCGRCRWPPGAATPHAAPHAGALELRGQAPLRPQVTLRGGAGSVDATLRSSATTGDVGPLWVSLSQPPAIVSRGMPARSDNAVARRRLRDGDAVRICAGELEHAAQVDALKAAGCERIFFEKASGKSTNGRREFDKLMRALVTGDTVMVTKLDRLARSSRDLYNAASYRLGKAGATPPATSANSCSPSWAVLLSSSAP